MKYVMILGLMILAMPAFADGPSTSCPAGYIEITEPSVSLADSICPTGYTSAGTVTSCLAESPSGACYMYAPTDATYSDGKGIYHYNQICPLT